VVVKCQINVQKKLQGLSLHEMESAAYPGETRGNHLLLPASDGSQIKGVWSYQDSAKVGSPSTNLDCTLLHFVYGISKISDR